LIALEGLNEVEKSVLCLGKGKNKVNRRLLYIRGRF